MQKLSTSIFMMISIIDIVSSISCYKCLSINGSNPLCDDLFQGDVAIKPSILQAPCLTQLRGRKGLFPATHCIKLVAYGKAPRPIKYTYRTCGRDEPDGNGIARSSHCGLVKLDWIEKSQRFQGCLHICDKDACNQAYHSKTDSFWNIIYSCTIYFVIFIGTLS